MSGLEIDCSKFESLKQGSKESKYFIRLAFPWPEVLLNAIWRSFTHIGMNRLYFKGLFITKLECELPILLKLSRRVVIIFKWARSIGIEPSISSAFMIGFRLALSRFIDLTAFCTSKICDKSTPLINSYSNTLITWKKPLEIRILIFEIQTLDKYTWMS